MLAALLHDVVDDTRVSLEEVRAEFGPRIARIVGQVAQLSTTTQLLRRRRRTHVRPLFFSKTCPCMLLSSSNDSVPQTLVSSPAFLFPWRHMHARPSGARAARRLC